MNTQLPQDQKGWNIAAMFAFVIITALCFSIVYGGFGRRTLMAFGAFDIAILALATFRVIRLITYDKIFAPIRDFFMDEQDGSLVKPAGGLRRLMAELIECMWCTGLWGALLVITLYGASSFGYYFVIVLAISAAGSFLQNVSRAVAKHAE